MNLRSTPRKLRMGSNPIAHMSGWSHSARKRKLALSPGVALRSTQVRMGAAPSLTWLETRKGRKRKEHVVCLSVTPFGWRHTERKETKGTRGLPERHPFWLETHRKEGNERNAWSAERHAFSLKPFSNRPHTQNFTDLPVSPGMPVSLSNGYLSAAVSLPEWLRGWT